MDIDPPARGRSRSRGPYPTPRKRRRSRSRSLRRTGGKLGQASRGYDSKDTADVYVHHAPRVHHISMAEKYAEYKAQASGVMMITRFRSMCVTVPNAWNVFNNDDRGRRLEFFTPKKFKDAEAVAFNGKALTENGYITKTVAVNGPTLRDICIHKSFVRIDMKNVSQHTCTLEMFVCCAKEPKALVGTFPEDDLLRALDMYAGNSNTTGTSTLYTDPMKVKSWTDVWHVKKIRVRMEPGETASHTLYGPSKYVMDPKEHTEIGTNEGSLDPVWLNPDREGNGFYAFFRILNDVTWGITLDGGTPDNANMQNKKCYPHHPVNFAPPAGTLESQGGIIVRLQEYYKMGCPLGVDDVDQRNILVDMQALTGAIHVVGIDSDQPNTDVSPPL